MEDRQAVSKRLPLNVVLVYGLGQTGLQIFRDTPAALLPVFLTTVLGIPPWLSGLTIMLPKAWIIICDSAMGLTSDRVAVKYGYTPFLILGAIGTSIGFFMLFNVGQFESIYMAAFVMCLLFTAAMTAFSAFSVPYLGIAAILSSDSYERTRILAYRMIFVTLGVLLGIGVAQPLVHWFGGGERGWSIMGIIFALICLSTMLGSALGLRSTLRGRQLVVSALPSARQQYQAIRNNSSFILLAVIHFLQSVGQGSSYTVVAFIFIYLVKDIDLLIPFILFMSIGGLSTQPLWLVLSRRYGKVRLFVALTLAWCAITLTWLYIEWGADHVIGLGMFGTITIKNMLVLLRGALIGVTNAGFVLLLTSLFTDTVYGGGVSSGLAVEGSYAGVWSAIEKVGFAAGPLIAGIAMSVYGFESSRGGLVEQDEMALYGVLVSYAIIPVFFFLGSITLVPAFKRRYDRIDLTDHR